MFPLRLTPVAAVAFALGVTTIGCGGGQQAKSPNESEQTEQKLKAESYAIDPSDEKKLQRAVLSMDEGKLMEAMLILDDLRKKYPHHTTILHEAALVEHLAHQPEKSIALLMPYRESLPAESVALLGSALDEAGRRDEAMAVLLLGIKRYPSSGLLHSEIGTTLRGIGKYEEAAAFYQHGIEVDPAAPSNYSNLAVLYSNSDAPVLTLFFGEAFRVLEPNSPRSEKIAELMAAVCRESVKLEKGAGEKVEGTVKLAPPLATQVPIENAKPELKLPFPNELEASFAPGLVLAHQQGFSLTTLHQARVAFLQRIRASQTLAQLPLYQWLVELDDAGYLEAYDNWLYGPGFGDEFVAWSKAHPEALDGFAQYLSEHPLVTNAR